MKVRREINDKTKRNKIVIQMKDTEDLYHLAAIQFDFVTQNGEHLSGHSLYLSITP